MNTAATVAPIEVYLSSDEAIRPNDLHNDCFFQFDKPIMAPQGYSIYLQLLSFTMPHCILLVNDYNRHIIINNNDYTLESGNYSIFQLVNVLKGLDPAVSC